MRSGHRTNDIKSVGYFGRPETHGLVHGVFQRAAATADRLDFGTEKFHALNIGRLPLDVFGAHEDPALHAEKSRHGGGRHSMLAGPGFGNQLALAHPLGQQGLPKGVVDLVGSCVGQIFTLEIDCSALQRLGQAAG